MEKKRAFLLITLVSLLMVLLLTPFIFLYGASILGQKITSMCVYDFTYYWYLLVDCILGTVMGGIIVLLFVFGIPLCAFLLLISFIFYIISGKKIKLTIPTMIITGLTVFCTVLVVGSLVILSSFQAIANMTFFIVYTFEPVSHDHAYYYGYSYIDYDYLNLAQTINDAVLHGFIFLATFLSSIVLFVPPITFILSIVFGIIARKKAKKEQILKFEEQVE